MSQGRIEWAILFDCQSCLRLQSYIGIIPNATLPVRIHCPSCNGRIYMKTLGTAAWKVQLLCECGGSTIIQPQINWVNRTFSLADPVACARCGKVQELPKPAATPMEPME